ncbi:RNA polymerase sigma factor [Orrella sp. JC864]|uniref:RNA polymerase sigma factor n=1 Tax=Orrella sp. JC864 TaxID=3120298 RepID=UPI0030092446
MRSPQAFLYRVASNIAIDRLRSEARLLSGEEADALLALREAPDTAEVVSAHRNIEAALRAMDKLTERQRQILEAVRMDGVSQRELAERYGISLRMVERELSKAHELCAKAMKD